MTYVLLDDSRNGIATLVEPTRIIAATTPADVPAALADLDAALESGYTAAGFFSYELGLLLDPHTAPLLPAARALPLLWFALTKSPRAVDAATFLPAPDHRAVTPAPGWNRATYTRHCRTIIDAIHAGEIYQANLTFRATFPCASPAALYAALRLRQPTPYGGYIETPAFQLLSLSPELFIEADGPNLLTRPMKGTAPRDTDPAHLAADPKNRAENLMIVDLMRNDLGRIAQTGSVRVENMFAIETHPTLHQMTSDIRATLRPDTTLRDMLAALLPAGSITGAPKIRAMEIISALEPSARNAYCGAFGLLTRGHIRLNVAIRTVQVTSGEAAIGTSGEAAISPSGEAAIGIGSGVVADSVPDSEYDECLLKMRFLQTPFSLIETMRRENGAYTLLAEHRARLTASARHYNFPLDWPAIQSTLDTQNFDTPHLVRLLLHADGTHTVTANPLGETPHFTFTISPTRLDPADPFLFHKTTHRPLYDSVKTTPLDEVVFLNTRGELCEGTRTSIFLRIAGRLLTPALSCGLLPGTLRANLLASGEAEEAILTPEHLAQADKIFLGNSVRGLIPARMVAPGGPGR